MSRARRNGGFTLLEMTLSLMVVVVIGAALASTIRLASRAAPNASGAPERESSAAAAGNEMAADLSLATAITLSTSTSIEVTVPDQNADGSPETIQWSWGGNAGDPLVRTVNGVASTRLGAAAGLTIQLSTSTTAEQTGTTNLEGAEQTLATYVDAGPSLASLSTTAYVAQYAIPTLPSDAVSYSVTRVKLRITAMSASSLPLKIRSDSSGVPGSVIYAGTLNVTTPATSSTDQTATISGLSGLTPGSGVWVSIEPVVLLGSVKVPYQTGVANGNTCMAVSSSAGLSWTVTGDNSAMFTLLGKVVRPTPVLTNLSRATAARVTITPNGAGVRSVVFGVSMPARPLMPGQATPTTAAPVVSLPVGVTITAGVPATGGTVSVDSTQLLNGLASGLGGVVGVVGRLLGL